MDGIQTIISGAFVSATINGVVKTAYTYFAGRYEENTSMKMMLDNLNASLPRIQSVLEFADQKPFEKNANLVDWLQQLKDVIYEAEDVMDDFEAIRIQDSSKNKSKVSEIANSSAMVVKSVLPLANDEIKLKKLVKKIEEICNTIPDLITLVKESGNYSANDGSSGSPPTEETSSFLPKNKKIFGRDTEIESILDMIITIRRPDAPPNHRQDAKRKERAKSSDDNGQTVRSTTDKISRFRASNLVIGDPRFTVPSNQTPDVPANQRQYAERKEIAESSNDSDQTVFSFDTFDQTVSTDTFDQTISIHTIDQTVNFDIAVGNPIVKVLPIVGIGGIGKTTIARVIYNHERVKKYFDTQGWVYVTSSPDPKTFVHNILCAFEAGTSKSTPDITCLENGHYRLIRAIEHKRFLLVFDDLREDADWISSTWKGLIEMLTYGACESTIIVTTISDSIATMIGTLPTLKLGYLTEQQFLSLFEYYAFGHDMKISNWERTYTNENQHFTFTSHEETVLKPVGRKIAKKLHPLPLAAVVVGSSLGRTKCREYWENILKCDWWECKNIVSSLRVGFHNLDLDLKQCFMYCSLFPRNHVFDKDRLVQMWIAQGFIHPTEAEIRKLENKEIEIEDIGRIKFDKLVDRFFFQSTESKNQFVMHDLIREFAAAISSDMFVYGCLKDNTTIPPSVRHLACDPNTDPKNSLEVAKWNGKHRTCLRTIMFLRYSHLLTYKSFKETLDNLVGLRLLDLSYFTTHERTNCEFPYSNCQLSHLRFLDLSFIRVTPIATSLCDLVHLQVLDLRGCYYPQLPYDHMNKLINLRHLYASPETISRICGIGRLTNLQELEIFSVRKYNGFTISELAGLKSLHGQLTIKYIKEVLSREEASLARIEEKKYLTSLIYEMGAYIYFQENSRHHLEVLEGLKPHKNIRKLEIKDFRSVSLPSWIMEMNNLTGIELLDCHFVETLPPFGSLPSLEVLKLSELPSITSIGEEFYGASNVTFPFLRELTFHKMNKWKTWSNPSNPRKWQFFPCLQKLQIKYCNELSIVPIPYFNLSLVELCIENCDEVVKNIGEHFSALTFLTRLNMNAFGVMKIDFNCKYLCKLQVLSLKNINIGKFEGQISFLVNLNKLFLASYYEIESLFSYEELRELQVQNTVNLPSLVCIEVHDSYRIPEVLFRLGKFPSLRTLWIDKYEEDEFTPFENSWLQRLSSLEELSFSSCRQLRCLPPSLSTLPSLKKFTLEYCRMIHSLPPNGLPQSLEELYIIGCSPELMQGCQPNIGAEWSKVSHVPCIRVVDKLTNLRPPAV